MPALQEIFGYFFNWKSLREHQKINYPILWDGYFARPYIISGQDARTTRNFGIFFKLEVSNLQKPNPPTPLPYKGMGILKPLSL